MRLCWNILFIYPDLSKTVYENIVMKFKREEGERDRERREEKRKRESVILKIRA